MHTQGDEITVMDYQEMTPKVRAAMLAEYNADQASPSRRDPMQMQKTTPKNQERFHALLLSAIQNGDGNSLTDAVIAEQLFGDPWDAWMARSEFSFWYVRGLSAVMLENGTTHCEIYLAEEVREPRINCAEYEGIIIDVNTLREHQSNNISPFSMPHTPWCHHLIRKPQPQDELPAELPVSLTKLDVERIRKLLQAGRQHMLPGETDKHSVYRTTFKDGCSYTGRTTDPIIAAEESVCGIPDGIYQWGASITAAQHAANMKRETACLASSLSDRQARDIQRYLMQNLPAGLHPAGNAMATKDDCKINASNQQMGIDTMRRFQEGRESA